MRRTLLAIVMLAAATTAAAIDHSYAAWGALLGKHVRYVQGGNASRVDYAAFVKDRAQLKGVLDDWQKVTRAEFDAWSKPKRKPPVKAEKPALKPRAIAFTKATLPARWRNSRKRMAA